MFESLRPQFEKYWMQLQTQVQANQRLRWMLWGVAYILVIYVTLTLSEWRQEHNQTVEQLQRTAVKLERLKTQTQWPERWQQEKDTAEKLRARLWSAESTGLAEADLQNYVRRLLTEQNAQNLRLRLAPTETVDVGGESVFKVTADVSGVISTRQIDQLLKSMADNPKTLIVERFDYSPQRAEQLSMMVTAYFLQVAPQSSTDSQADNQHVNQKGAQNAAAAP